MWPGFNCEGSESCIFSMVGVATWLRSTSLRVESVKFPSFVSISVYSFLDKFAAK